MAKFQSDFNRAEESDNKGELVRNMLYSDNSSLSEPQRQLIVGNSVFYKLSDDEKFEVLSTYNYLQDIFSGNAIVATSGLILDQPIESYVNAGDEQKKELLKNVHARLNHFFQEGSVVQTGRNTTNLISFTKLQLANKGQPVGCLLIKPDFFRRSIMISREAQGGFSILSNASNNLTTIHRIQHFVPITQTTIYEVFVKISDNLLKQKDVVLNTEVYNEFGRKTSDFLSITKLLIALLHLNANLGEEA